MGHGDLTALLLALATLLMAQILRQLADPAVQRQIIAAKGYTELIALLRAGTVAE